MVKEGKVPEINTEPKRNSFSVNTMNNLEKLLENLLSKPTLYCESIGRKYYHITPAKNVSKILKNGLDPKKPQDYDDEEGVYLFKTKDDVEDAMMNWLGDKFDEDEELALLEIDGNYVKRVSQGGVGYEVIAKHTIPGKAIKLSKLSSLLESAELDPQKAAVEAVRERIAEKARIKAEFDRLRYIRKAEAKKKNQHEQELSAGTRQIRAFNAKVGQLVKVGDEFSAIKQKSFTGLGKPFTLTLANGRRIECVGTGTMITVPLRENKYPGLSEAQEEVQEYYHCTPAKNLASIMKRGLMHGDGETFGNHDWSEGKIFISRGYEQAKSWQEVIAEMIMEDVAILHLKLSPFQIKNLYVDDVAYEQDGNEESFYTLDSILPNQIEIADDGEGLIDHIIKESKEIDQEDYRIAHRAPGKEGSAPLWDVSQGIYPDDIYTLPASTAARYYGAGERHDYAVMGLIQRLHNKPKAAVKIFRAVPKAKSMATKIAEFEVKKREHLRRGKLPSTNDMSREEAMAAQGGKSAWYDWVSNEIEALQNQLAKHGEPAGLDIKTINPGDWITIWRPYAVEHGNGALNGEYKILTKTVPASTLYTDGNSLYEFGYNT